MFYSFLVGLVLAAATIAIHGGGTTMWIGWLRKRSGRRLSESRTVESLRVLCLTAVALLSLHMMEVIVWAMAYLMLIGGSQFPQFEQAVYFSTVTFSSLGYGDIVIDGSWRLLSAIQSMVGLLVFGWSSALLFVVVQHILRNNEADGGTAT